MLKKMLLGLMLFLAIFIFCDIASAGQVNIIVDDSLLTDKGTIINGRTLVPVRSISEALGSTVTWNPDTKEVTISKLIVDVSSSSGSISYENRQVSMVIGEKIIKVNGVVAGQLDVPAQIINGKTLVPIKIVSEWMDATVYWDGATNTVNIKKALNSSVSDAILENKMNEAAENEVLDKIFNTPIIINDTESTDEEIDLDGIN